MHQPSRAPHTGGFLTPVTCPALSLLPGVAHGFFTRSGGVSSGIYASLNCAYGTGDAPENVTENRRRVVETLRGATLAKAYQVHGSRALIATEALPMENPPQADAVVTNTPGLVVAVTTADCLPILFADNYNRVAAACHAGWKGARAGIIDATITAMRQLGAQPAHIAATIGPAIAQGSYEVGLEFHERFIEQDSHNQLYFIHGGRPNHFLFDLKAYAKDRLRDAGISAINMLANDTCLEENDFFSYRRATLRKEPAYGCQLSAIVLEQ